MCKVQQKNQLELLRFRNLPSSSFYRISASIVCSLLLIQSLQTNSIYATAFSLRLPGRGSGTPMKALASGVLLSSPSKVNKRNLVTGKKRLQSGIGSMTLCRASSNDGESDQMSENNWAWAITLILPLWFVYISNQWSRYSISYLVDFSSSDPFTAMNLDIGFDQAQYGILASVAFTLLYAVASLFAGVAADKLDRKLLTLVSCIAWSAATLGTALAGSYEVVLLWRIAMGLACAFATPTAYTLIQQKVPKERVALASSMYGTGVALGSGLSSLSIVLDNSLGWRQTEILIASLGFLAAILGAFSLPSDPKTAAETSTASENKDQTKASDQSFSSAISDVQNALQVSRVQWIYLASFLRFCSGLCIGVWGAPYFRMVFPDSQQQYSVAQAAISAVGATASGLLGGAAADYLSQQKQLLSSSDDGDNDDDPVGRRLWVPVIGSLLAAPTWYFAVNAGVSTEASFQLSMTWLAAEYFVAECWFGPTISSLQATVGPKIGGTAQGLFTLTGAMANLAPTLLGYLYGQASSSASDASSAELSTLLITGVCFGYLSSAFCFGMAAKSGPPSTSEGAKLKQA